MSYTLDELADEVRALLSKSDPADCQDALCAVVKKALVDDEFVATHLDGREPGQNPREILYEDPDLGFCICGHIYGDEAIGKPHDHGPSWALYGQAEGSTEMTDWKIVKPANGEDAAEVVPDRTYTMNRGDAHFYGVGHVHSPARVKPTKLVRLEGENLDNIKRTKIKAAE